MVELDISKGLSSELEIEWKYETFFQIVDYWKLTFQCSFCREVGNMRHNCLTHECLPLTQKVWKVSFVTLEDPRTGPSACKQGLWGEEKEK